MGRHGRPLPRRRTKSELRRDKLAAYFALAREAIFSDRVIEYAMMGIFVFLIILSVVGWIVVSNGGRL